ncbi:hypothetical protein MTO96_029149, partial [Rhipicephalus appendiculatus]
MKAEDPYLVRCPTEVSSYLESACSVSKTSAIPLPHAALLDAVRESID